MVGSLMGMAGGAYGVARGEGGGMTPEEFVKKINKRDLAGGNLHLSIPGGMVVDSISDLNAYAKAHDRAVKDAEEARKKFREAKTEDELREHGSAAMEHLTAAQLVKEAIQYAVNLGGWSTEKTKNKNLPKERPLNWKENPHVAKWLVENAERFGFDKLEDMQDVRDFLLAPREASFPGLTPGPTQGPVPITEPPVESVKKPAEEKLKFPGLVAPKKATITEPETATQRPSHRGVSLSPSEFVQKLDALDVAGGNNALSIPAGMSAASIADLEEYAKARERAIQRNKEVLEKYSQAKTEEEKSKFDKLLGQPQIASQMAREAILYAVDWGTWSRAESPPDLQAERPLDWKKNPDVAKWLLDNAERIGIDKEPYMPQLRAAVEAQSKKKAKPEGAAPEQIPAPAKGAQFTNVSTPGADSRAISGHYAVVEASDAITSTQPGYDMRLQGRDRSSRASAEQIQEIVSQLKPWELGESHTSDQGAPFLNPNNNVLSGNGRIMALRKHYDAGGTQYKDWLVKNAAKFGLNPDEVAKMQRPILVRYATDYGGLSEPDFAARSNARVGAAFTEAEFARSDAMLLENNPDMLRLFNPSEEGDIIAASNHSFLTAFVNSVIDGQSLRTREGFNSAALSRRVKNAMLALVLGTERQNLISTLVESSGDMGMSNLVNGVMRAASKLIQLRGTAYDISIPLGQALDDFVRIKRSGQKLVDFLGQRSLFGDDGRTAMSDAILISLTKMKSIKSAFEALSKYADEAKKQIEMAQVGGGLFGEQPLSAQQIWGNLSENEPTATQQTLPPAKPQGPSGEPPEPAGTTPVPEPPDKGPAPATGGGEPEKPVQPAPTGETKPVAETPPEGGPAQGEASLESAVKPEDIAPNPAVGNGEVEQFYMGLKKETGIPDGVKDPGIEFAPELMEASRRLGTLVRTYSALKPGVLGRYLPGRASIALADKIEVGDIENLATAAHEMGHDIDALLFPTIWSRPQHRWHTQESLAERIGLPDSRKGQLMSELIQVSVIMRGVIPPSGAYNKYRRRATELIADWFSMYAFDPELAKNLAPLWTEGFERALAGNPDVQETVQQLHAGNVIPIPGSRSPGAATGSTPADMPGAMPPREVPTPTREVRAAVAAEELVKGVVRLYEAMVQKARIRSDRWRKLVPIQQDRNDVGAFVEGIGNLEIPGDTLDKVQRRMTPEKQKLAKQYRLEIEKQRGEINQLLVSFGDDAEYLAFLMDYLPHFYINAKTPLGVEAMSKFMKQSKNAKQRKLPSLQEAVKLGLIPVSQDPAVLAEIHARINWRVATNRVFLQSLKNIKTSAGEDVVVPASKNPGGWPVSNNPLIQRVYAKMGRGAIMLWRGGAAIHPDVWHAVRQILETPTRTRLGRIYDAINSFTRANAFAFSFFHDITLAMASAGSHGTLLRPLRGLVRIFERDPATGELRIFQTARSAGKGLMMVEDAVFDAAKHGLKFSWTDSESYQVVSIGALEELAARLRHIPVLGKTTRFASDLQNWRQRKLWRDTHDALKLLAYHDMVSKALSEAPAGTVSSDVKEMIASLLNDAFGGQEWQTKFWLSPQARMVAARFWLAPDWTLSTLRSVPFVSDTFSVTGEALQRALGKQPPLHRLKEGWKGNMGRLKFWRAELTVMALATIAAQYAIYLAFGDDDKDDKPWPWENEEGQNRRIDVTPLMRQMPWWDEKNPSRYYVNMGKRPEEVLHWVTKFDQNIQSKLARPINEAIRQIVGMEGDFPLAWKREHMTFVESIPSRAKSVASLMVPYTFSGNQFALSLPYRKGMSKYKAQHAFESAYEVIGTPNRFGAFAKSLARGHFTKDMEQVLVDIADAASRNGVQVDMVRRQALSEVRSRHYTALFREYQNGDLKAMEREAEALFRLGATIEQINASIKRREKSLSR